MTWVRRAVGSRRLSVEAVMLQQETDGGSVDRLRDIEVRAPAGGGRGGDCTPARDSEAAAECRAVVQWPAGQPNGWIWG